MAAKTKPSKTPPRHLKAKHRHREVWLDQAMHFVRRHFAANDYTVPEHVRVGVGWPSRGALSEKKRTIGQAWTNECSADNVHEIIISLWLDDPIKVLGVLIHEVIHVTVGVEHGHKKPFTDCMKEVGLCGKATATEETPELVEQLKVWVKELGQYPHAKLDGLKKEKKQSTRLLKMECGACGCVIRTTQKWVDEHGDGWDCPCQEGSFTLSD